jgi:hypothetical protein
MEASGTEREFLRRNKEVGVVKAKTAGGKSCNNRVYQLCRRHTDNCY